MSRVLVGDGCWAWTGWKTHDGYGGFTLGPDEGGPKTLYAHRVLYELFVGPIPEGYEVDHLCFNEGCCNPEHLDACPKVENLRRRESICKKGHMITEDNRKRFSDGGSCCLRCYTDKQAAARAARRARGFKKPGRKPRISSDHFTPKD